MSFYKNKALKITCIVSLIMICFVYHHYLNTDTKQIKFGATYMTMNNTFYKAVNNEIENVVNNHGDVLYTRDPALDPKKQNEQIKDLISLGIDVLIINPVESSSINKTLKEVKKAGIKIIVVDAPISDDQIADCTVSAPLRQRLCAAEQFYGKYSIHMICDAFNISRGTF